MEHVRKETLADWIAAYENEMYDLAYALLKNEADAQDAVGEVIVKIFEQNLLFENKDEFRTWLIQSLMDQVQKIAQNRSDMEEVPDIEAFVCDDVQEKSVDIKLWNMVDHLDSEYRMILLLYYFESFSMIEISEMIRLPVSAVCSRLEKAREMLKEMCM